MAVVEASRTKIATELTEARQRTEQLFSALLPDYLYARPIAERHRVVFYIGHLEAFDYAQICQALGQESKEPDLDALFQAGIDPDSQHLPTDTPADWPSLLRVRQYVTQSRSAVDAALDSAPEPVVCMALEHRLMHLETLAYMWHNFGHEMKRRQDGGSLLTETSPAAAHRNEWCDVPAGRALLGKARDDSFGWDNEFDEHAIDVPAFRVQRYKVTNGEYLQFVKEGAKLPHFWADRGGNLYYRGMFEEAPLPLDWPVYVTHQEATAYAHWLGKALPTEAQYHRAAFGTHSDGSRQFPWGESAPAPHFGNFDFRRWDPESVMATPRSESAFGARQLVGNGWEWTATAFAPFAGFRPMPTYPGYSANFFDGAHYVIKGGSPQTGARLLRRSFRNWFRPDYPYVYAAFRCAEN